MPKLSATIILYSRAKEYSDNNQFTDAIACYERALLSQKENIVLTDAAKRTRSSCYSGLAEAKVKLNNYKLSSVDLVNEIRQLLQDSLEWSRNITNPTPEDYLARTQSLLELAMISMGGDLLDESIADIFLQMNTVIKLAVEIDANYDIFKDHSELINIEIVKDRISVLFSVVAEYLMDRHNSHGVERDDDDVDVDDTHGAIDIQNTDGIDDLDNDAAESDSEVEQTDIDLAEHLVLTTLEILDETPQQDRDDNYWRMQFRIYTIVIDIYANLCTGDELNYYPLMINDFKNIQQLTVEDINHENNTYHDYTDLLCSSSDPVDLFSVKVAVNNDLKAIERFAALLNSQTDLKLIETLYNCILDRFKSIDELFARIFNSDSFEVRVATHAVLCFTDMPMHDATRLHSLPQFIVQLHDEAQAKLLQNYDITPLRVHALLTQSVMSLYRRHDFPNKQLAAYLLEADHAQTFRIELVKRIMGKSEDVELDASHISDSEVQGEVGVHVAADQQTEPVADAQQAESVATEKRYDFRKRKPATLSHNRYILMPDRNADDDAKRRRADPPKEADKPSNTYGKS